MKKKYKYHQSDFRFPPPWRKWLVDREKRQVIYFEYVNLNKSILFI